MSEQEINNETLEVNETVKSEVKENEYKYIRAIIEIEQFTNDNDLKKIVDNIVWFGADGMSDTGVTIVSVTSMKSPRERLEELIREVGESEGKNYKLVEKEEEE